MILGAHIGIADGLPEAVRTGRTIGCDAIQIFSKSPQMWAGPPIAPEAATAFRGAVLAERLRATAVHHGYLANLASPKRVTLQRSRRAFVDEAQRAELLGVDGLIFHPGAHVGAGPEAGLKTIAESLSKALEAVPEGRVRWLLENAAGQGTTLGARFEELATVLALVNAPTRLGVCLDTCHLFAFGIDLRDDTAYGRFVDDVERALGRATVRAFHLNDAKADLGSHLDRHENIGRGQLGVEGFRRLLNDRSWDAVPGYLETPLDEHGYDRYADDLRTLRGLEGPERPRAVAGARSPSKRISTVK
ncbi:MAG TPA: deoxyribonuclease IV [Thermoplasmata archaeon]|nr:deoxyribonuclease IV [Thermoplasmata archaeon]